MKETTQDAQRAYECVQEVARELRSFAARLGRVRVVINQELNKLEALVGQYLPDKETKITPDVQQKDRVLDKRIDLLGLPKYLSTRMYNSFGAENIVTYGHALDYLRRKVIHKSRLRSFGEVCDAYLIGVLEKKGIELKDIPESVLEKARKLLKGKNI